MESVVLEVETRERVGKGPAGRARARGKIPAVFYGPGSPATPLELDARTFNRKVHVVEGTHLLELKSSDPRVDGRRVLVRDLQVHPVTGAALHVDFVEVPLDKPIQVLVPLHFVGKPEGVALGGVLQPVLREIEVSCLPTSIPQSIDVDVSGLGIHDSLHVDDLTFPAGAKPVAADNPVVVTVQPPTAAEKPAGEEGEEGALAAQEGAAAPSAGEESSGDAESS